MKKSIFIFVLIFVMIFTMSVLGQEVKLSAFQEEIKKQTQIDNKKLEIDLEEYQKKLKENLKENRKEFFKRMGDESARRTNLELAEEEAELIKRTIPNIELYPQYWMTQIRLEQRLEEFTDEYYLNEMRENLKEVERLTEIGMRKIKWQRRFNTAKSYLKWGLLIYIAIKI